LVASPGDTEPNQGANLFRTNNFDNQIRAIAGGSNDCTEAIRKAISACHEAGGGRVIVPSGEFFDGRDSSVEQGGIAS